MKFKRYKFTELWDWIKTTAKNDKWALIISVFVWLVLKSPGIAGLIFYIFSNDYKWMTLALSWFTLTALPFPIPVIPISIAAGIVGNKLIKFIKQKKSERCNKEKQLENKEEEQDNG